MGVSWVQPLKIKDVLVAWRRWMKKCWTFGGWKMIPWLFGGLLERNHRIFEGKDVPFQGFKPYFLRILCS